MFDVYRLSGLFAVLPHFAGLRHVVGPVPVAGTQFDLFTLILVSIPAVLSVVLTGALAAVGYLYKTEYERRLGIERQLSDHKYTLYIALLDIFADIFHGPFPAPPETVTRLNSLNKKLVIYGSDGVMRAYRAYMREAMYDDERTHEEVQRLTALDEQSREALNKKLELLVGDVILAIRRDMGNQKTKITSRELAEQFFLHLGKVGLYEETPTL